MKGNLHIDADGRADLRLESFLPYMLNRLAETVSAELSTIYTQEFGLSITQWRVIANLAQQQTLKAQEIVNITSMQKSKVSRAVNALEERGLVTHSPAPGDSRSKDLSLTDEGVSLYQAMVPKVLGWEQGLLEPLSAGEYRDLLEVLEKLRLRLAGGIIVADDFPSPKSGP